MNSLFVDEQNSGVDPGDILRGLVGVRGRLETINDANQGEENRLLLYIDGGRVGLPDANPTDSTPVGKGAERHVNSQDIAELDERVGKLESVTGSSTASLGKVSYTNLSDISWC